MRNPLTAAWAERGRERALWRIPAVTGFRHIKVHKMARPYYESLCLPVVAQSVKPRICWLRSTVGGTPVFGRRIDPVLRSACNDRWPLCG